MTQAHGADPTCILMLQRPYREHGHALRHRAHLDAPNLSEGPFEHLVIYAHTPFGMLARSYVGLRSTKAAIRRIARGVSARIIARPFSL